MSSNLWMAIFAYNSLSTLIPLTHTTLPPFDNSIHRHKSVPVQLSMNYRSPFLSSNPFPLENFATSFEKFESPRKSVESSFFDRQPIWTYSSLETVILNLFLVEKRPIKVLSSGQRITLWTNSTAIIVLIFLYSIGCWWTEEKSFLSMKFPAERKFIGKYKRRRTAGGQL